jgi:uncharacterized protein YceK
MRHWHHAFAFLTLSVLAGCGTCQNLAGNKAPFGGVAWDVNYALHGRGTGFLEDELFRPVAAIDTPISLVGDTFTLPIVLYAATSRYVQARIKDSQERTPEATEPPRQRDSELPGESAPH